MDYAKHYVALIGRARERHSIDGYVEKHHVLPRCMGGTNDKHNIVLLTGEEHYVAHQLLVKMFPHQKGLALAAVRMSAQCGGRRSYAWLRKKVAEEIRGRKTCLGKVWTPEERQRQAENQRGKKYSEESRLKMRLAKLGKKQNPEHVAQKAAKARGSKRAASVCLNISAALTGKKLSPEHCAAISMALKGAKKTRTPEHQANLTAALRGKKRTGQALANIRAGHARRASI